MRKIVLPCLLLITLQTQAFATWSIIAVDRKTGQIVIASATCVPQQAFAGFPAKGLKDVQAIIIPGIGVAAAQANVDRTRRLQKLIADQMNKGTDPVRIIYMAHVAYIVAANKSDKMGEGLNDGSYHLEIQVTDQDITPGENDNPVKTLRLRYDRWVKEHAGSRRSKSK